MSTKWMMIGLLAVSSLTMGQKVKSAKETEAVQAMLSAKTPDDKIKAVDNLIAKFKDTEFKAIALEQAGEAYEQKGDAIMAIQYGNRALEADPKNFSAMLLVSRELAQSTKEFDLDKDEKVKKASELANNAITTLNAAAKPNPALPDDQWVAIKKDLVSQAHDTLGVLASIDKKYDVSITEFKTSIDGAASVDVVTMARLAAAYNAKGRFDDASAMADKVIATAGAPDSVKKFAQGEKQRAEKGKASKQ